MDAQQVAVSFFDSSVQTEGPHGLALGGGKVTGVGSDAQLLRKLQAEIKVAESNVQELRLKLPQVKEELSLLKAEQGMAEAARLAQETAEKQAEEVKAELEIVRAELASLRNGGPAGALANNGGVVGKMPFPGGGEQANGGQGQEQRGAWSVPQTVRTAVSSQQTQPTTARSEDSASNKRTGRQFRGCDPGDFCGAPREPSRESHNIHPSVNHESQYQYLPHSDEHRMSGPGGQPDTRVHPSY